MLHRLRETRTLSVLATWFIRSRNVTLKSKDGDQNCLFLERMNHVASTGGEGRLRRGMAGVQAWPPRLVLVLASTAMKISSSGTLG